MRKREKYQNLGKEFPSAKHDYYEPC